MEPRTPEVVSTGKPESLSYMQLAGLAFSQLRPKQWAKNLIVYAPSLFSGKLTDPDAVALATLCAVSFCMISSGIYILNDVLDVEADRAHPVKCQRPIASGRLSIPFMLAVSIICLIGGFSLAFWVRPSLTTICLAYVVVNVLYCLKLKHFAIIDVLCIASGFVLRAVAGAVAVKVLPSAWFLLCTTLGSLFLALEKRRHEVLLLDTNSTNHRKSLSEYSTSFLIRLENLIVPSLLTCYAFYSFQSIHGEAMMLTVPVVLYGVMRYQLLSERGDSTGTPEEILFRDGPIQMTLLVWVLICALVIYGQPGVWLETLSQYMDSFHHGFQAGK